MHLKQVPIGLKQDASQHSISGFFFGHMSSMIKFLLQKKKFVPDDKKSRREQLVTSMQSCAYSFLFRFSFMS